MRLLLGEPGSGKTTLLLENLRRYARGGRGDVRYVVPTATMRDHLANALAREGVLVRPSTITTLAGLLDELAPGRPAASAEDLRLLTAEALDTLRPPALEPLRDSPGLAPALAASLDELAGAGCGPGEWEALGSLGVWEGERLRAFGLIYEHVDQRLRALGLLRRPALLREAERALTQPGAPRFAHVFFDGFFTFSPFELRLIEALVRRTRVDVALPAWSGADEATQRLCAAGLRVENLHRRRATPAVVFAPAPDMAREADDLALRLRELHAAGTPWRECGVILRARLPYGPLIETTFARFGIPWRAYSAASLLDHCAARCLALAIDACAAGWPHGLTLDALREPACRAGAVPGFAEFVHTASEDLPGEGLASLGAAAPEGLHPVFDTLTAWSAHAASPRTPAEWAASFHQLLPLLHSPAPGNAAALRSAAVRTFLSVIAQAVRLLESEPVPLVHFWNLVRPAVDGASLRDPGNRRDAVHLLDVYEARQWELPHVFVCGLEEGQFPRRPPADPILPDALRLRLRSHGVHLALTTERDAEERFVFDIAASRATRQTTYSWPEKNDKGEVVLRSFALDLITGATTEPARRARPRPGATAPPLPPPALDEPDIRRALAEKFATHRPTALESFLQCPFQFYLRYTEGLRGEPESPAGRLNPLFTGAVLHDVLHAWHQHGGAIEQIFDQIWPRSLQRERIPSGHTAEFNRALLRRSLIEFVRQMPREPGWRTFTEVSFELDLAHCRVRGRIDRFDLNEANDARVFDFKFSSGSSLRQRQRREEDGLQLQGGLYLLALARQGYRPLSFHYVGIKNEFSLRGWEEETGVTQLMEDARVRAEDAAFRILEGRIDVNPRNPDACGYCDYLHACRIQSAAPAGEIAEAAG